MAFKFDIIKYYDIIGSRYAGNNGLLCGYESQYGMTNFSRMWIMAR